MKKKASILLLALTLLSAPALAAGCTDGEAAAEPTAVEQTTSTVGTSATSASEADTDGAAVPAAAEALFVTYDEEDNDDSWDASSASYATLSGDSIRFDGVGATVEGSTVTITAPGTYVLTGTLDDGRIVVASEGDGTVRLVLDGAQIHCSTGSPIYVGEADKTIITLAAGADNKVSDGAAYTSDDPNSDEADAAIFSKDDLTINGAGSLEVSASYKDGIVSKDDLKITGGVITVAAVNDALKGRDCIGVKSGTFTLTAGNDALQSTNDEDSSKGYISIEGGVLLVDSGADGIQAQTTLAVSGGDLTIVTNGGNPSSSTSAKALKAGTGIFIAGGEFQIDSSDDSVHSNGNVTITGGSLAMASGDDGIHADAELTITGGDVDITKSYEGLEATVVTIDGGTIRVQASDDGINVAGGADGSSVDGRPGQNAFVENENNKLYINGGYLYVDAGGDALDCNGRVEMTGGTVIANGPTNDGNGALDYMGEFKITGGFIVAVGSSGMAEAPSDTSSQYSLMVNFEQAQQAGTLIHIESEDGEEVLTFAPTKQFQSVVFSSPDLKEGATYKVYLGGTSTGAVSDSVYSGGAYSPGAENVSLTLAGMVTTSGATGGMRGPGGMGRGGARPQDATTDQSAVQGGM